MVVRTLVFEGGTSNKFWSVEVVGSVQTVRYGRVGTAGRTKVVGFPDGAAACAAADALVAEKVRKGYVERGADDGAGPAPGAGPLPTPVPAPGAVPASAPAGSAPAASGAATEGAAASRPAAVPRPATAARSAPPAAELESRIDLHPHEWAYASWRPVADPPGPPPPFDPARASRGLRRLTVPQRGEWRWSGPPFEGPLSAEEAAAWLWATYVHTGRSSTVQDRLVDPDAARHVRENDPFTVASESLLGRGLPMDCLVSLVPPGLITAWLLADEPDRRGVPHWYDSGSRRANLIAGVRAYLLPQLTPAERGAFAAAVRAKLATVRWPTRIDRRPDEVFLIAAQLGLHEELQAVVDSWPVDRYLDGEWDYHEPQSAVFGLGSPQAVLDALSKLRRPWFRRDWHLAAFLAHTGTAELHVAAAELADATRDRAAALMGVLARVHDVEFAAPMLALTRTTPVPGSREWLAAHPLETLVGAARLLARPGRARDQALDLLRARKRAGVDVTRALPFLDAADAARLTELVVDHEAARELGPDELPTELARDLTDPLPAGARRKLPSWIDVAALPPVVVDGRGRLADDAVRTVLLTATTLRPDGPTPPLLATVRAHADSDEFAWALVGAWLAEGAPSSGRWAFLAAGALGGDRTATRLAPLIRAWPGESQHPRAVLGLDVLAAIGSDTALMLLDGIAQKVRYKGLQRRAREAMEQIAEAEGMTTEELADRIVPDGGLDEHGARSFDFGPRQFDVVLGPGLRPMVRDAAGRARTALPKPNAKDDPALAAAAAAEWKLLKKVVGDLVEVQSVRLEQAMVTQRRWSVADFDRFVVRHPLQRHLARLLVWGAWDPDGSPAGTFRVTDELDLADVHDEPFTPGPDHRIGVVHPLQLPAETRAAWGELLADYEIVPPFPQLGRPVHDVGDDERRATDLTRFAHREVGAAALLRTLEDRGWQRGVALDNGMFCLHAKPFPAAGVTAVVEYHGLSMGYAYDGDDQSIEHCYVLPRVLRSTDALGWGLQHEMRGERLLAWGEVDPIVRSEVLADVHALLARAVS